MRRASVLLAAILAVSFVPRALAGQWNHVSAPTDFEIVLSERGILDARTVLCFAEGTGWCDGVVDSQLWLYSADGTLLAVNDDAPNEYGSTWASRLSIELEAGTYRLRAGRCCGNPDAWRDTDSRGYDLETNVDALPPIESPSPEPSPELSPEPSPTVEPSPEPSSTPDPSPSMSLEASPSPVEPSPIPSESPTMPPPSPSPSVAPSPTIVPTPPPTPTEAPPTPTEPPPSPTEPPPSPTEPPPSIEPTPPPTEPPPPDVAETVGAAIEVVGEAVDAVIGEIGKTAERFSKLGSDLSPAEREKLAAPVVAAVIISQVGGAVAAASAAASRPNSRRG